MKARSALQTRRGRLALMLGAAALLALLAAALPAAAWKRLADALARDGSMERLTPGLIRVFRQGAALAGLLLLGAGALTQAAGARAERMLARLSRRLRALPARLRADAAAWRQALRPAARPRASTLLAVGGLTLLGGLLRAAWLDAPMQYDEAYTYLAFASRPLPRLVSDYHLPNNHIFHSLLVHFSTRLLGVHPWSVRLPAFLAGTALIPLGYLLTRRLYGRAAALLSAALIAVSPELIGYSANARGYTLIALFTLLCLLLAVHIRRSNNLLSWLALSLLGALGAWTVPIMLYPFGMTLAWLALGWLMQPRPRRASVPWLLLACGLLAFFGALLLYTPVLLTSGLHALAGNRWVSALPWDEFWESLPARLLNTWKRWTQGQPSWMAALTTLGVAAAWTDAPPREDAPPPLWAAALTGILPFLAAQRVAPIPKVWLFLLPLWLMWSAAGLMRLLRIALSRSGAAPERAAFLLAAALCALSLPWQSALRQQRGGMLAEAPAAAAYIQARWRAGDGLLTPDALAPSIRFALREGGIVPPREAARTRRLWVVLNPAQHARAALLPQAVWPEPLLRLPHLEVYLLPAP